MLFCATISVAQEKSVQAADIIVSSNFPLKLEARKPQIAVTGIDMRNIYDFTVDFDGDQYRTSAVYTILYSIDHQRVKEFENQTLPFSFKRNLKGQPAGIHTITLEIEDMEQNILARQETVINVVKD